MPAFLLKVYNFSKNDNIVNLWLHAVIKLLAGSGGYSDR